MKVSVVCPGFINTPMADTMVVKVGPIADKTALGVSCPQPEAAPPTRSCTGWYATSEAVIVTPRLVALALAS